MDATPFWLLGACFAFVLLGLVVVAAFWFLLVRGSRKVAGAALNAQVEETIEDWAEDHGYELLGLREADARDNPFTGRYGNWGGKRPGIVMRVKIRDRDDRVRRGWILLLARGAVVYLGYDPGTLEVEWED
ncbi:MAG TPA: hypothetical protein VKE40_00090 [Gemmataceae bacterium]|nr:hypothetical protein [Gemmataceae bacterium]